MKRLIYSILLLTGLLFLPTLERPPLAQAQQRSNMAQAPKAPEARKKFATGLVIPKNMPQRIKASWERHGKHLMMLPRADMKDYDCRTLGLCNEIKDQGQCGDCYIFSGVFACEVANIKAGKGKVGQLVLSEQEVLSCANVGGCGGGMPDDIAKYAKEHGLALTSDYGPYTGGEGNCKESKITTWVKIDDYGFVGREDGVPPLQAIKDAIVAYGPISVCVAADDAFMNLKPGEVFHGNSDQINHAVDCVGWHDDADPAKSYLICRNSWNKSWCDKGYGYVAYGANSFGYAAMWCRCVSPVPPPTPPVPPGPGPGPGPVAPDLVSVAHSGQSYVIDFANSIVTPPANVRVTLNDGRKLLDVSGLEDDDMLFLQSWIRYVKARKKEAAPPVRMPAIEEKSRWLPDLDGVAKR